MSVSVELSKVCSSKDQKCHKCGKLIPKRTPSIKTTKKVFGDISITKTYYTCLVCDGENSK